MWNGSIDRSPGLIARCTGVADVRAAVGFARQRDLLVAVRGGGHSFAGLSACDDGMLIDLGPMKGIRVDPEAGTVRAQAGVLLGELDRETQEFGLAVPSGIVTHTGMAGLTLGGGIGWVMRKYGLTIDQLKSVDVVTADGEFVRASEDQNADLFWGVRG
ncbi:MAG: FAD-binding oxidoreductase, partial [Nocardioidaceae bacterium]